MLYIQMKARHGKNVSQALYQQWQQSKVNEGIYKHSMHNYIGVYSLLFWSVDINILFGGQVRLDQIEGFSDWKTPLTSIFVSMEHQTNDSIIYYDVHTL